MSRALIASAVLAAGLCANAPAIAETETPSTGKDMVAATVNGEQIMESELQNFYEQLPPQYRQIPFAQIRPQLMERLINQAVVAGAARKEGYLDRPDVQARVAHATQRVLNEFYISDKIKAMVTDDKVKDEYQKSIALETKSEEVRARHILVKTEDEAKAVIAELQGGADFATVARSKSTGPSGRNGGDLGYFGFNQMVPAFAKAAFALKPGEITSAPVQTRFGWHIIKLEDRRVAGAANFEQASQKIRQELSQQAYQETIDGLRAKATIDVVGGGVSKIQPVQ